MTYVTRKYDPFTSNNQKKYMIEFVLCIPAVTGISIIQLVQIRFTCISTLVNQDLCQKILLTLQSQLKQPIQTQTSKKLKGTDVNMMVAVVLTAQWGIYGHI
jgi:hypothetical protein